MPRTTINGQAVADFVAEFSYLTKVFRSENAVSGTTEIRPVDNNPTDPNNIWNMRIDGSSNINGSGADTVLESPTGEKVRYALRL